MKLSSIKGVVILAGMMLAGFALTPFIRSFGSNRGILQ